MSTAIGMVCGMIGGFVGMPYIMKGRAVLGGSIIGLGILMGGVLAVVAGKL